MTDKTWYINYFSNFKHQAEISNWVGKTCYLKSTKSKNKEVKQKLSLLRLINTHTYFTVNKWKGLLNGVISGPKWKKNKKTRGLTLKIPGRGKTIKTSRPCFGTSITEWMEPVAGTFCYIIWKYSICKGNKDNWRNTQTGSL